MTSNDAPAEVSTGISPDLLRVLAQSDLVQILTDEEALKALLTVIEAVSEASLTTSPAAMELRLFTPKQAAALLGKTANWVVEQIYDGLIPHTRVGKSPRLSAEHIREIARMSEFRPQVATAA